MFKQSIASAPPSMASSNHASLVPDVGGGPRTSIFTFGSVGLISLHFSYGLSIRWQFSNVASGPGTFAAIAKNISSKFS